MNEELKKEIEEQLVKIPGPVDDDSNAPAMVLVEKKWLFDTIDRAALAERKRICDYLRETQVTHKGETRTLSLVATAIEKGEEK